MQKQKDMENTMLMIHRRFVEGLEETIAILEKDLGQAGEMEHVCTDEWCQATEDYIDDLHKNVYSISEPRWATEEDSKKIRELRQRVKKLYTRFEAIHS
jgi:hypothetical protein